MIITNKQLDSLSKDTKVELLFTLYKIEDELRYKCKSISKAINYLQKGGMQNAKSCKKCGKN